MNDIPDARAHAFVFGIQTMAKGAEVVRLTRRQVEVGTGMRHQTWPLAGAAVLGVVMLDPGEPETSDGPGRAGSWGVHFDPARGVQSDPAGGADRSHIEREYLSTSTSTEVVGPPSSSGIDLHPPVPGPTNDCWAGLGGYRWAGWLLATRIGLADQPLTRADLARVLDLSDDQAKRLMRALKAGLYVDQAGTWHGRVAEVLDGDGRDKRRQDAAAAEVAAFRDRPTDLERLAVVRDGFRRYPSNVERAGINAEQREIAEKVLARMGLSSAA